MTQMFLVASEFEKALEPAFRAAEMSDTGDGYDTYGYIHYVLHNYQLAADAFQEALDKGELDNRADTLLFLSRALIELDNFDPEDALIRRFMLNARGVMGREVPIPDSKGYFCTLSHATNLTLQYFPASELWSFVIAFDPQAELLAGGLATCLNVGQISAVPGENAK